MKSLSFLTSSLVCAVVAFGQETKLPPEVGSIVEAERAFARAAVMKGIRDSFLENMTDDAILFRPGPVPGKKWMTEHPAPSGVLTWYPIFADVSRAGDMGYTTGPWEFREKSLSDKPVAHGQFVTIWKKQADGTWKFVVDLGTRSAPPETKESEVRFPSGERRGRKTGAVTDTEAARLALVQVEEDYSKVVVSKKTVDSFLSSMADDVRLFRMDAFPAVGKQAVQAALTAKPGVLSWKPVKADVSRSGDLGYTYGSYEFKAIGGDDKAAEKGSYVRIWKRQKGGKWRVVLDILNPTPPPAPTN
jgi:ketosteroid isomerase-like protein